MSKTNYIFLAVLGVALVALVWAFVYTVYFNPDYGVIEEIETETNITQDETPEPVFDGDNNPNAKM